MKTAQTITPSLAVLAALAIAAVGIHGEPACYIIKKQDQECDQYGAAPNYSGSNCQPPIPQPPNGGQWDCGEATTGIFKEQFVNEEELDPLRKSTSKTMTDRGCRQYRICKHPGLEDQYCWGPEGPTQKRFPVKPCPPSSGM